MKITVRKITKNNIPIKGGLPCNPGVIIKLPSYERENKQGVCRGNRIRSDVSDYIMHAKQGKVYIRGSFW